MSGEGSRNIVITLGSYSNGSTEARIINPANGDPMAIGSATTTIAGGMVEANGYTPTGVTIGSSSTNHLGANYILKSTATIPSPAGTYVIKCTTGNTAKPTLTIGTVTKAEAVKKMTVTGSGADGIINAALPATGDTNSIQVTTPVEDISSGAYMYVTFKAKQSTSATLLVQNHSSNTAKCFIVSGSMTSPLYASINATTGGSYTLTANTVYTIGIVFDEDRSPMGTASISISTS